MATRSLFLLLDIDNTIYNFADTGFDTAMREAIYEFARVHVGLTRDQAVRLSHEYLHSYGLSLHGYVKHYHVDARAYSDAVHRCSYDTLRRDDELAAMLRRLRYDAVCAPTRHHLYYYTNANRRHAHAVLRALGLRPLFLRPRLASRDDGDDTASTTSNKPKSDDDDDDDDDTATASEWCGFSYEDQWELTAPQVANKPMRAAYEAVFAAIAAECVRDEHALPAGASSPHARHVTHKRRHLQPSNVVMVDDSLVNLIAPLELGWCAVWHAHGADATGRVQTPPPAPLPPQQAEQLAKEPLASAYASGRLQVIQHILDLEEAIDRLACLPHDVSDDGDTKCVQQAAA